MPWLKTSLCSRPYQENTKINQTLKVNTGQPCFYPLWGSDPGLSLAVSSFLQDHTHGPIRQTACLWHSLLSLYWRIRLKRFRRATAQTQLIKTLLILYPGFPVGTSSPKSFLEEMIFRCSSWRRMILWTWGWLSPEFLHGLIKSCTFGTTTAVWSSPQILFGAADLTATFPIKAYFFTCFKQNSETLVWV